MHRNCKALLSLPCSPICAFNRGNLDLRLVETKHDHVLIQTTLINFCEASANPRVSPTEAHADLANRPPMHSLAEG